MPEIELVCDWCKEAIPPHKEINIDRYEGTEDEFMWEVVFCSNEHASLWVANPVAPVSQPPGKTTWGDRGCAVTFFGVLLIILVLSGIGAVASARWLF